MTDVTLEEFKEFTEQLTDEEYLEVGESIIEVVRHLLIIQKNGHNIVEAEALVKEMFSPYEKLQECLGEYSSNWFSEKSKSVGLPEKYKVMYFEVTGEVLGE